METATKVLSYVNSYIITIVIYGFLLCSKMERRKYFWFALLLPMGFCVFYSTDFFRSAFSAAGYGSSVKDLPYLIGYVSAALSLFLCFRVSVVEAFLYQSIAYLFEHMVFNIRQAFSPLFPKGFYAYLFSILVKIALGVFLFLPKRMEKLKILKEYQAVSILLSIVNIAYVILLNNWFYNSGWFSEAIHVLRIFICIALIYLPFILAHLFYDKKEQAKLEQMLIAGAKERKLSKENIEAINRKCHDLKYQIAALKQEGSSAEYQATLDGIEKDVMIYDAIAKTGNSTLDIVLTEKSLLAEKKGIDFTYMIDGNLLSFMDKVDLYVLFGNALDNAIEALSHVEEGKKVMTLRIFSKDGMTIVDLENYCPKAPDFVGDFPKTTKKDAQNHGYGVKSIASIAKKYGGETKFEYEDERFILTILFTNQLRKDSV